jgi:hypothetical protein
MVTPVPRLRVVVWRNVTLGYESSVPISDVEVTTKVVQDNVCSEHRVYIWASMRIDVSYHRLSCYHHR